MPDSLIHQRDDDSRCQIMVYGIVETEVLFLPEKQFASNKLAIQANFSKIPKTAVHGSFYGLLNLRLQRKKQGNIKIHMHEFSSFFPSTEQNLSPPACPYRIIRAGMIPLSKVDGRIHPDK
ncbi:MAG: hypothetical protein MRK02_08625 [Candidatus Scalindua sp.]|nr:hypothetical protein [Candidatus Scalindua sp.]